MYKALITLLLAGMVVSTGCTTTRSRDEILADLLADMEEVSSATGGRAADGAAGDSPDRPVSGLPRLTDVKGEAKTQPVSMLIRNDNDKFIDSGDEKLGGLPPLAGSKPEAPKTVKTPPKVPVHSSKALTIQPDCVVQIGVTEDPALDDNYPVNEIGAVDFKYVGPVILLNKTEMQAAAKIKEVLLEGRGFRKATVKLKILRASYDKVKVSGAVEKQGLIRIGAGDSISLNNALLRAGGIKASAKGAKIRVVRDGLLSAVVDAMKGEEYALVTKDGTPKVPDVKLNNNDVVFVFSSEAKAVAEGGEKEVLVVGEVNRPGVYRFSGSEPCTIMHLIFKMGGLPPYANKKAIVIRRRDKDGEETEIKVNAERILKKGRSEDDITLENNDTVVVPARRISLF